MKTSYRDRQKGVALLDALIASLLVMILGLGGIYVTLKAMQAHQVAGVQQFLASELRGILATTPLETMCDSSGTAIGVWARNQTMTRVGRQAGTEAAPAISFTVKTLCYPPSGTSVMGISIAKPSVTLAACAAAPFDSIGPLIIREGANKPNEPTTCPLT